MSTFERENHQMRFLVGFLNLSILFFFVSSSSYAQVVINEFSPSTDTEWIEFYNASSSAEYIKNYYLDDDTSFTQDAGNSSRRPLTNLSIANDTYPTFEISSFLNNSGDYVVLFDANGVIIDQYQYEKNPGTSVTIGRFPDQIGNFATLDSSTQGFANSNPVPTPIPTPTVTPTATPKVSPTNWSTPKPTVTSLPLVSPQSSSKTAAAFTNKASIFSKSPEILGETTNFSPFPSVSPLAQSLSNKKLNPGIFVFVGGIFLSAAGGFLLYQRSHQAKLV